MPAISIITKNLDIISADNYRLLVNSLRKMEIVSCSTNEEYMRRVAKRFKIYYGKELIYTNEVDFIEQLKSSGEIIGGTVYEKV